MVKLGEKLKMISLFSSYSQKLIVSVLLLSMIPVITVSTYNYLAEINYEKKIVELKLELSSTVNLERVEDWVEDIKLQINNMAQNPRIILNTNTLLNEENQFDATFALETQYDIVSKNNNWLNNIVISDTDGNVLFFTGLVPLKINLKAESHFQKALDGETSMSDVYPSSTNIKNEVGKYERKVPSLLISSPIISDVGIIGVLTSQINIFELGKTFDNNILEYVSEDSYVVDSAGYFLTKSKFPQTIKNMNLVERRAELELKAIDPISNKPTLIFQDVQKDRMVLNLDGYNDYRGEKVVGSISAIKGTDWFFISEIDYAESYQNQFLLQTILVTFDLSLFLLIFLTSFLLSNNLTTPIKKITNLVERFGKGESDVVIDANLKQAQSELGALANTFENMITTINEDKHSLRKLITAQNTHKRIIEDQLEELKRTDMQKDEFATMISHELKTPLVPIKGYAEMLKDPDIAGNLTEEQHKYVNEIYDNSERLEVLIRDVLDVQKIALGQMTFTKEKFIVSEFLTKIRNNSESLLSKKQIQLEIHQTEEITINCDKDKLQQVFDNLIRNAVDFVPRGTGKIEIGVESKKEDILFYVQDNGIGIPKHNQKNLFKKFYQVDTSQTREHGGTGLGLVICKGLVEGLGGKIWVISEGDGKGTVFYFTLPKN